MLEYSSVFGYGDWSSKNYFNEYYFQYGGTYISESPYGLSVLSESFTNPKPLLKIYENFPGDLYKLSHEYDFDIEFIDYDKNMSSLEIYLTEHWTINDENLYTHTSDDGRYSFKETVLWHRTFQNGSQYQLLVYDNTMQNPPFYIYLVNSYAYLQGSERFEYGWLKNSHVFFCIDSCDSLESTNFIVTIIEDGEYIKETDIDVFELIRE